MLWVIVGIVFLGFVLRITRLDQYPLWGDEFISMDQASPALPALFTELATDQVPLYFVLLHAWFIVAGSLDFALRFPSVVWGCLGIPLVYQLGRQVFGVRVGLIAALLLSINPFSIWYSQDARVYPQLATLSIASLLFLHYALTTRRPLAWAGYAIAATLTFYTHLYAALPLAVALVYAITWLWTTPDRKRSQWAAFLTTQTVIGLLLLPWVVRFVSVARRAPTEGYPNLAPSLVQSARLYTFGDTLPASVTLWIGFLALALFAVGLVALAWQWPIRSMRPAIVLAWSSVCLPAAALAAIQVGHVGFHPRYFNGMMGPYVLILAVGLVALAQWRRVLGVAGLAVVLAITVYSLTLFYTDRTYAKATYTDYLVHILADAGPNDALLLKGADQRKADRYGGNRLDRIVNLSGRVATRPQPQVEAMIAAIAAEHSVVWLAIRYPEQPDYVKDWLDQQGFQVQRDQVDEIQVYAYTFPATMPPPRPAASVTGPAPITLKWSAPSTAKAGEIVPIELRWEANGPVNEDGRISLRLYDSQDNLVWKRDRVPGDGAYPSHGWHVGQVVTDRYGIRLPRDLAPGTYTLRLVFYDYANLDPQIEATLGTLSIS